jgi:hypothetical protein
LASQGVIVKLIVVMDAAEEAEFHFTHLPCPVLGSIKSNSKETIELIDKWWGMAYTLYSNHVPVVLYAGGLGRS